LPLGVSTDAVALRPLLNRPEEWHIGRLSNVETTNKPATQPPKEWHIGRLSNVETTNEPATQPPKEWHLVG